MNTLAFGLQSLGTWDMLVILLIALLIFGKRLPDVGKSLGKGIVEFKKGLKGIDDDIDQNSNRPSQRSELPDRSERGSLPPNDERRVGRADPVEEPTRVEQSPRPNGVG